MMIAQQDKILDADWYQHRPHGLEYEAFDYEKLPTGSDCEIHYSSILL